MRRRNTYKEGINWHLIVTILFFLLLGGCAVDLASSSKKAVDAVIYDKEYQPGHYDRDDDWVSPKWIVIYQDEHGTHRVDVYEGIYRSLRVGQKVFVSFREGGYTKIRYTHHFTTESPSLEKW